MKDYIQLQKTIIPSISNRTNMLLIKSLNRHLELSNQKKNKSYSAHCQYRQLKNHKRNNKSVINIEFIETNEMRHYIKNNLINYGDASKKAKQIKHNNLFLRNIQVSQSLRNAEIQQNMQLNFCHRKLIHFDKSNGLYNQAYKLSKTQVKNVLLSQPKLDELKSLKKKRQFCNISTQNKDKDSSCFLRDQSCFNNSSCLNNSRQALSSLKYYEWQSKAKQNQKNHTRQQSQLGRKSNLQQYKDQQNGNKIDASKYMQDENEMNRIEQQVRQQRQGIEQQVRQQRQGIEDYKQNTEINEQSYRQMNNLIPIRRPITRKQYFVFGMNDKHFGVQNRIENYRDLLWKINYSNSLYVYTPNQMPHSYKFYVGPGIMKRRFWWVQANNTNQPLNFVWTQLKNKMVFNKQSEGINKLKFMHNSLRRLDVPNQDAINQTIKGSIKEIMKETMTMNETIRKTMKKSMKDNSIDHIQVEQLKIVDYNQRIFGKNDYKNWLQHINRNRKVEQRIQQNTYIKRSKLYSKKQIQTIQQPIKNIIHNHLQQNYYIGNKKALLYNIKKYMQLKNKNVFQIIPYTYHIINGTKDNEYKEFIKYYKSIENNKNNSMWIIKPGQNTNRGYGITVCYNLDDIQERINGKERNSDGKLRTFVLQKYIEKPLLFHKRKFDIRHYMLVTCINAIFKAYWFQEGYLRTSSFQYTGTKFCKDPMVHLTNDAIQKKNWDTYGKHQVGNKVSYADFQKYLDSHYTKKFNFMRNVMPQMKNMGLEAFKATYGILDAQRREHNFELLGLDFMIDEHFKPWLIEVNTNPCLEMCCPLLNRLIPSLIENVIRLAVDPLFPPPEGWPASKRPFFAEDVLAENRFELIFDQLSDGKSVEQLYGDINRIDKRMGVVQEDNDIYEDDGVDNWEQNN